jgi:hypothetical protein
MIMIPPKKSFPAKVANRLGSNFYQISGMLRTLSWPNKLKYLALCLRHAPSILKTDRLLSVDERFAKSLNTIEFQAHKEKIEIPFKQMEEIMDRLGNDIASLELVRELFGNNEYLRAFNLKGPSQVTLDIGSNRGFFAILAHQVLKSKKIICIEPQKELQPIRYLLAKANNIPLNHLIEYHQFCSANDSPNSISINQILKENQIDQIDFLKMDIEGGEADVFSDHLEWLDKCKNITMEIHYSLADVAFIPALFRSRGFNCILTDLRGRPIPEELTPYLPRGCAYLYASKEPLSLEHADNPR